MEDADEAGARLPSRPELVEPELLERLRHAPIWAIPFVAQVGIQKLLGGPCLLCGWSLSNSGAGGDAVNIWGDQAGVTKVAVIGSPGSGGGGSSGPSSDGVFCPAGLSVTENAGNIAGVLWVKF